MHPSDHPNVATFGVVPRVVDRGRPPGAGLASGERRR